MLQSIFDDDICELVIQHLCACTIQTNFRKFMFRHTRQKNWLVLLELFFKLRLQENMSEWSSNYWIRKEWRQEIMSWIDELPLQYIV